MSLTWVSALTCALWIATGTASLAAWAAVAFIALMPAAMMIVMANTPPKSMAEIIRDVESGHTL